MKILFLNYEYPPIGGGGSMVCQDICEQAAANGNQVDVITMNCNELKRRETVKGVHIHRIQCWRKKERVCHPWEQASFCIMAYGYIKKYINITEYDFIHCHFIIPTGILALWLKQKYGIPYLVTAHGSDVLGHNNSRFRLLYQVVKPLWIKILKNASVVTAPSTYLINKIKDSYCPSDIRLIPNGIHPSEYPCAEKKKLLIVLARLQKSKGVQKLIEACSETDLNGWKIHILGDGPYRGELEKMVKARELQDKIFFQGYVTGDERIRYLSEAGAFFSGSEFEAFPVSVLEASIAKCNVIASNIEPHRMLVGEQHVFGTQEELKKLLRDVFKCQPCEVEYGNEKYDWKYVYEKYKEIYGLLSGE